VHFIRMTRSSSTIGTPPACCQVGVAHDGVEPALRCKAQRRSRWPR
jgi:hypothetical protein